LTATAVRRTVNFMRSIPALVLLVGLLPHAAAAQSAPDVAYVLSVRGPWTLSRTQRTVRAGQPLQSGDRVALPRTATKTDAVTILDKQTNQVLIARDCAVRSCTDPIVVPALEEPPVLRRVLDLVMQRWEREGDRTYTSVASRSAAGLFEGVVSARNAKANLRQIAGDLSTGAWTLVWQPISPATTPRPEIRIAVDVGDGSNVDASLADIQPGLYQVRAFRRGAKAGDAPESESWVVAADDCAHEDALQFFDEATEIASAWATEVSGDVLRRFLRAALAEYASTMPSCR
jgi:hypothetical protein